MRSRELRAVGFDLCLVSSQGAGVRIRHHSDKLHFARPKLSDAQSSDSLCPDLDVSMVFTHKHAPSFFLFVSVHVRNLSSHNKSFFEFALLPAVE